LILTIFRTTVLGWFSGRTDAGELRDRCKKEAAQAAPRAGPGWNREHRACNCTADVEAVGGGNMVFSRQRAITAKRQPFRTATVTALSHYRRAPRTLRSRRWVLKSNGHSPLRTTVPLATTTNSAQGKTNETKRQQRISRQCAFGSPAHQRFPRVPAETPRWRRGRNSLLCRGRLRSR